MTHCGDDLLSVVVCTRNRGADVVAAVRSLLASPHPAFEVVVVDQSSDEATRHALAPLLADERLRYVGSRTAGLSRARNEGLAVARGAVVAMTDDDCEAAPGWLADVAQVFAGDPTVAAAFFTVRPGPHDPAAGIIPHHIFSADRRMASVAAWRRTGQRTMGLGAAIAVRRAPALQLGGFDPQLGAGAPLQSAEDLDLPLRLLLDGYTVACSAQSHVVHHGLRTWPETKQLYYGYSVGPMATYAKLLRGGDMRFLAFFFGDIWREIVLDALRAVARRQRPRVLGRLRGMLAGFVRGMMMPLGDGQLFADDAAKPKGSRA